MGQKITQPLPPFSAELYQQKIVEVNPVNRGGQVEKVVGLTIEAQGPPSFVGEICSFETLSGQKVMGEVVGFREGKVLLLPLGEMEGIGPGTPVLALDQTLTTPVGEGLLGRVLDGLGRPLDGQGKLKTTDCYPLMASPPNPLARARIKTPLSLGVKAIDGLLTSGQGQRLGIFAGSGVGKSTLLGMIARNSDADINVIGLIGERGREVKEFIEKDLGPEGLARSVVVAATSDQPALVRIKGAYTATAIAEYFRDQGANVLLMMDSVTRFALAQREVGLAVGEPPATRGYTPSVFALIPKLLERSGTAEQGTITALYTVLVEGDDMNEPVADTVRGTLDGHIVLSRALAHENHYPAIDILASVSRLMIDLASAEHQKAAALLRELLAVYTANEDLINIGAYVQGSNPRVDLAIKMYPGIQRFLRQAVQDSFSPEQTVELLKNLVAEVEEGVL